jgi:hypothetical protein
VIDFFALTLIGLDVLLIFCLFRLPKDRAELSESKWLSRFFGVDLILRSSRSQIVPLLWRMELGVLFMTAAILAYDANALLLIFVPVIAYFIRPLHWLGLFYAKKW